MHTAIPALLATETVSIVPYELIPRSVRFLACRIDAGFPSPAADDLEEPVDLAAWLVLAGDVSRISTTGASSSSSQRASTS